MTQETKNIMDPNQRGYQSISIPDLSPEDIFDLRAKVNSFRRGSLVGLTALCFVGALGLASHTRNSNIAVASNVSLLRAGVEVEETGMEDALLLSFDSQYSTAVVASTLIDSDSGYCPGVIDIPDNIVPSDADETFINPYPSASLVVASSRVNPICIVDIDNAKSAFKNGLGAIAADMIGDTKKLENYFKNYFGADNYAKVVKGGAGVWKAIGGAIDGIIGDLECRDPDTNETPSSLQIEDVARIAKDVVEDKLRKISTDEFQSVLIHFRSRKSWRARELVEISKEFHDIAMKLSWSGYEATLLASNAAKASFMMMDMVHLQTTSIGDTNCSDTTAYLMNEYRKNFKTVGTRLRQSLNKYKSELFEDIEVVHRNHWGCAFGLYYNQYVAKKKGNNGEEIANAHSQQGWSGKCPGNKSKQDEAKNLLKPKLQNFANKVERLTWTNDIKYFYDEMSKNLEPPQ